MLFYRVPPPVDIFQLGVTINESFEYSESWSGTINNVNYPDTFTGFDSPSASINEAFELSDGWPA